MSFFISSFLGFRYWMPVTADFCTTPIGLESITRSYCWQPGQNEAQCLAHEKPEHQPVDPNCMCGIYCHHKLSYADYGVIAGAIEYWGRGYCHIDGARAQYARLLALSHNPFAESDRVPEQMPTDFGRPLRDITQMFADHYDVPFVEPDQLESYGLKFAEPIPIEFRPAVTCAYCEAEVRDIELRESPYPPYLREHICPSCTEVLTIV